MDIFRNISIRNKVIIISMLTCVIVSGIILITFILTELTASRRELREKAATLAEVIGINSIAALTFNDQKSATETLAALAAEPEIEVAALYTPDRKLFAQYLKARPASGAGPAPAGPPETYPRKGYEYGPVTYTFQGNFLELTKGISLDGESMGGIYLRWSLAHHRQRLGWYILSALLALLPSLLIAYLLSAKFQRIISQPIVGLAQTMKVVSQEKDYSLQVEKQSEDELGALIDGFNEMLAQIQKRDAALEQHREVLEQEVARRTAELSQSNRELEETIDELNRTAHFLAQNERRLAYAQQVARLGYWEWEWHADIDKLILSAEASRLLGWKPEEFSMKQAAFIDLIHPGDREAVRKVMDTSAKTGEAFGLDFRILTADGTLRILHLQGEVILAQDDKFLKMTGTIQDITERKDAERALIESEEKYRTLVDNASEGILLADVAGNLLEANKKMLEMLECSLDELLRMKLFQLIVPEEEARVQQAFQDLLRQGAAAVDNSLLLRQDGQRIPIEITASLVRYAGKTVAQAILRDISERKNMEEERLMRSKLESLGILAGGIAHDFNNILTAILGNINMALLDYQKGKYSRERLQEAENACMRAQALARQLLTFAKGGAPVKELVSLEKLITESVYFASRGSAVNYELNFPTDLWATEADPGQLSQVFQNLVINAIQAMPTGGTIKISGENLVVAADSNLPLNAGRYVKISVRDEGMGIPEEYLSKIFDPYFTTKQTGSGLGLATAYSIVRNHQGHIAVESRLGKGTIFQVYLPATEKKIAEAPAGDREVLKGQGRILVMDDEETVRVLLEEMLARLGFEATTARNGEEAVKLFTAAQNSGKPFDAVILDLTIPGGMGGKETIRNLLEIDPQVKALVSSGYSDDPIMADFSTYGFKGVIAKPFRIMELSKILLDMITLH